MAKIAIEVDDDVLRRARSRAQREGTSVSQVLSEHLRAWAGEDAATHAWRAFVDRGRDVSTSSGGRDWTRDDLYQR